MAPLRPRPGILEIEPYVGGKAERRRRMAQVIKLSANEAALGPSPQGDRGPAARRPRSAPLPRRRRQGAARRRSARRFDLDPERIVCGAGSDELIQLLMRAYAGPGDEVLYSAHGFLMYRLCALGGRRDPGRGTRARPHGRRRRAARRASPAARAMVFLANPNNPTGSYLTADELRACTPACPTTCSW